MHRWVNGPARCTRDPGTSVPALRAS
jgi:hypothetical protein